MIPYAGKETRSKQVNVLFEYSKVVMVNQHIKQIDIWKYICWKNLLREYYSTNQQPLWTEGKRLPVWKTPSKRKEKQKYQGKN